VAKRLMISDEAFTASPPLSAPAPDSRDIVRDVVDACINATGLEPLEKPLPRLTELFYLQQRATCALAQADRFRQRAIALAGEAAALRRRLDAIESSSLWRAMRPVRRLGSAVPPEFRRLLLRIVLLLWWGLTLQLPRLWRAWHARRIADAGPVENLKGDLHSRLALAATLAVKDAPVALIIDNCWPQPDRDSGSVDTINMVDALLEMDFRVMFAADLGFGAPRSSPDALLERGVHCLAAADAQSITAFLEQEGARIDLCILNRIFGGGRFLEAVRQCPAMPRIIFNPVDLHFVREERQARLRGDNAGTVIATAMREREQQLARETDATIVVSAAERALLAESVPQAYVVQLPLARDIRPPKAPFEARSGIGFIAGFAHLPNVDALQFFVAEIWPLVINTLPGCKFSVVGPDLPTGLLDNVQGTVSYLGHLPEIGDWLESLRLTIAPIRYGAGAKGKIASSLAAGVPCVTTSIGAEGMELQHGVSVLIGDTPEEFAAQIEKLYNEPILWALISAGAQQHAQQKLSIPNWRRSFREMIWTIGAIPTPYPLPRPPAKFSSTQE
jgi:glycosyltransferase involved in cell wall biosynthesis